MKKIKTTATIEQKKKKKKSVGRVFNRFFQNRYRV